MANAFECDKCLEVNVGGPAALLIINELPAINHWQLELCNDCWQAVSIAIGISVRED